MAKAQVLLEDGIAVGKRAEILEKMLEWKTSHGFLTKAQRKLIDDIARDLADFQFQNELRNRLILAYNEDRTPREAEGFIRSVCAQFDEHHTFTRNQLEQLLLIVDRADHESIIEKDGE